MPTLRLYVRIDIVRYFQLCHHADPAEMIPIMVDGNVVDSIAYN